MRGKELVSIITPSYNTAKYIDETIQSVLSQTYTNWEMIIVDDCSTDNTDEIVAKYDDERIIYVKNEKNSGAAVSRNRALRMAKGKWIAFLDSDDVWHPEKLERQVQFMIKNNYRFTCTDFEIKLNGKWLPYVFTGPKVVDKKKLYKYCYFSTITVMYDREYVGLVQIVDLKKRNDYAMWFQIIEKTNCYRLPQCLSYYYKHDESVSSGSKFKLAKHQYIMYRKGLKKGKIISVLCVMYNILGYIDKNLNYKKKIK